MVGHRRGWPPSLHLGLALGGARRVRAPGAPWDRRHRLGHCPRVHVSVDFKRRAYAREVVEVDLSVLEVGRTSVRYAFVVRGDGETVAEGVVTAVFVRDGRPARWPEDVRRLLLESGRVEGERYARSTDGSTPEAS